MKRSVLLLAVVAVLAYAGAALAEDTTTKPKTGGTLKGVLVSITIDSADSTKATLVVGKEKQESITVDSTTKIRKDEAKAKLSDLKVGDMMTVTPGSGLAKTVIAKSPKTPAAGGVESGKKPEKPHATESVKGALVSITIDTLDSTKATLVVGKEKEAKVNVDSTTKIRKDEADAKLSDLKVGDLLVVTPGESVAKLIVAKAPKAPKTSPATPKTN